MPYQSIPNLDGAQLGDFDSLVIGTLLVLTQGQAIVPDEEFYVCAFILPSFDKIGLS